MKRILLLTIAALSLASAAFAADNVTYASLVPKTAKSMGLGGVFSSVPTAEFSFFGNPAAFAAPRATLILPTIDAVVYLRPNSANIARLSAMTDTKSIIDAGFKLMADNGGTGMGLNVGLGLAGRGLGIGAFLTEDTYVEGTDPSQGVFHTDAQGTAIVGLALPLQLGDLRLAIGGDLRPFYRISFHETALLDVVKPIISSGNGDPTDVINADAFFGLAMDLGATLQLSSLTVGLSIRDIAPAFPLWSGSLKDLMGNPTIGTDTANSTASAQFIPNVTLGLSWAPKLIPGIIDPAVYFEIQDPVAVFSAKDSGSGTFLNLFHAGAEVKLLSFITLRGGLNRGWMSAGAGVKLLFIDVNASVFTEELGPLPGDKPRSGMAVQAAIRF
jgi:hypothetical protein